ncbi:hypothetical protein HPQ64_08350 [Rhizobiales bacterium]|uniref:hypothetical protein n=1 Tax=Hongsoonwoonella zoysiae TaxID=2821844 RepID=UPI00155F5767|nr:hypothetical protein [Hongsoonwoonella zoysiae]NRG17697.1 hypothetical protein [Hongsoonwoonella zoysiae]
MVDKTEKTALQKFRAILRYSAFAIAAALPPALLASSARAGPLSLGEDWAIGIISIAFSAMLTLSAVLARHLTKSLRAAARRSQDRFR